MEHTSRRDHAMTTREIEIARFLAAHRYSSWNAAPLAGDASSRRYQRLTSQTGDNAILMDWPPVDGGDTRPFAELAEYLRALGVSAPAILAQDHAQGLLLIEDLGDALFTEVIAGDPTMELPLYGAAVDLLVRLHDAKVPDLPSPNSYHGRHDGVMFSEYRHTILVIPQTISARSLSRGLRQFYAII